MGGVGAPGGGSKGGRERGRKREREEEGEGERGREEEERWRLKSLLSLWYKKHRQGGSLPQEAMQTSGAN